MTYISHKKTHEKFISEMQVKAPNIEIRSIYINCKLKVECKCLQCGNIFYSMPNNLLLGRGCAICSKKAQADSYRKSHSVFIEQVYKIHPNIKIIGKYESAKIKIEYICQKCNNIHKATPSNLLYGFGCPSCYEQKKQYCMLKSHEQFLQDVHNVDININIMSQYKGSFKHVKCKCSVCDYEWHNTPTHLLSGEGCPGCKLSNGERKIHNFLTYHNIGFIPQKKFRGLLGLGGGNLSYDFYLPDYNLLIEYQGQFHDGTVSFQTEQQFIQQKKHDELKRKYAHKHSIRLLEIWYPDLKNIQKILSSTLDIH